MYSCARRVVITAVLTKHRVSWHTTMCRSVNRHRSFADALPPSSRSRHSSGHCTAHMKKCSSETSVNIRQSTWLHIPADVYLNQESYSQYTGSVERQAIWLCLKCAVPMPMRERAWMFVSFIALSNNLWKKIRGKEKMQSKR